jgi:hypothetical protein
VCVSVSIYLLLNIQTRQISAEDLGFLTSGGAARGGGGGALCANLLDSIILIQISVSPGTVLR